MRLWFLVGFSYYLEYFDECATLFQNGSSQYDAKMFSCEPIATPTHGARPCSGRWGYHGVSKFYGDAKR